MHVQRAARALPLRGAAPRRETADLQPDRRAVRVRFHEGLRAGLARRRGQRTEVCQDQHLGRSRVDHLHRCPCAQHHAGSQRSWRATTAVTLRASAATSSGPSSRQAAGMLYVLVPGSNRSRNHSRCCANDSGSPPRATGPASRPPDRPGTGRCRARTTVDVPRAAPVPGRPRDPTRPQADAARRPPTLTLWGIQRRRTAGCRCCSSRREAGDDLRRQQRVPTHLEEVVVHAHLLDAQDLAPDLRDHLLERIARRHHRARPSRCGRTAARARHADRACRRG